MNMSFTVLQLFVGATALKLVERIGGIVTECCWCTSDFWYGIGLLLFVIKYFVDDLIKSEEENRKENSYFDRKKNSCYELILIAIGWLMFYRGIYLAEEVGIINECVLIGILIFTVLLGLDRMYQSKDFYIWFNCFLQNLFIIVFCFLALFLEHCVGTARFFAFANLIFMVIGCWLDENKRQK